MPIIKEDKHVDLSTKSKPWTKDELADFRKLMQALKAKNTSRKVLDVTLPIKLKKSA